MCFSSLTTQQNCFPASLDKSASRLRSKYFYVLFFPNNSTNCFPALLDKSASRLRSKYFYVLFFPNNSTNCFPALLDKSASRLRSKYFYVLFFPNNSTINIKVPIPSNNDKPGCNPTAESSVPITTATKPTVNAYGICVFTWSI